jgi:hypothetical protein
MDTGKGWREARHLMFPFLFSELRKSDFIKREGKYHILTNNVELSTTLEATSCEATR